MEGDRLLTVPQVAERLQVSPRMVRAWLPQGRLRGVMLGGTRIGYRVAESELARFVREEGEKATP